MVLSKPGILEWPSVESSKMRWTYPPVHPWIPQSVLVWYMLSCTLSGMWVEYEQSNDTYCTIFEKQHVLRQFLEYIFRMWFETVSAHGPTKKRESMKRTLRSAGTSLVILRLSARYRYVVFRIAIWIHLSKVAWPSSVNFARCQVATRYVDVDEDQAEM